MPQRLKSFSDKGEQVTNTQEDYMIRAIAGNGQIRAFAITDRGVVEEARRRHGTMPLASAALGRTMTGALLMSDMLKNPGPLLLNSNNAHAL